MGSRSSGAHNPNGEVDGSDVRRCEWYRDLDENAAGWWRGEDGGVCEGDVAGDVADLENQRASRRGGDDGRVVVDTNIESIPCGGANGNSLRNTASQVGRGECEVQRVGTAGVGGVEIGTADGSDGGVVGGPEVVGTTIEFEARVYNRLLRSARAGHTKSG